MKNQWEQKLEQMLSFIYAQEHLDPVDTYDFAEEISDTLSHVLRQCPLPEKLTDALGWIGRVYFFAVQWCFDRDICGDYFHALEYCEKAFGNIFHQLSPKDREQMRLWFWEYMQKVYPENLYYVISFFFRFPWEKEEENLQMLSKHVKSLPQEHPLHGFLREKQNT